jgi:hypothetical protein
VDFDKRIELVDAVRLMPPHEKVLSLTFEMALMEVRGGLNLAVPVTLSHALLRKISVSWGREPATRPTGVAGAAAAPAAGVSVSGGAGSQRAERVGGRIVGDGAGHAAAAAAERGAARVADGGAAWICTRGSGAARETRAAQLLDMVIKACGRERGGGE